MYYFCADFCTVTALYYKDNEYVLFLLQMPSTEGDEWLNVAEQYEKMEVLQLHWSPGWKTYDYSTEA